MLDACWGAAAELQKEDFDRQIFQHLRDETPDVSNHPVSAAAPDLCVALDFAARLRLNESHFQVMFKGEGVNIFPLSLFSAALLLLKTCTYHEMK